MNTAAVAAALTANPALLAVFSAALAQPLATPAPDVAPALDLSDVAPADTAPVSFSPGAVFADGSSNFQHGLFLRRPDGSLDRDVVINAIADLQTRVEAIEARVTGR